ncbi:S9 family peptidase [Aquisalimonas sp.]|uniref:S9 family peptidase n=1 Tax=Aquisalimonas sp. TaxID=1872621 RepID=UPI0025C4D577|nr:S9 family peptidase [Aquisalimonas sp.]
MRARGLLILVGLIAAGSAAGSSAAGNGEPPLIDMQRFFEDPKYMAARLSPNGEEVAFLSTFEGAMNIWVKGVDEPFEDARPVTAYDRSVGGYFWGRDSKSILYVQDAEGDENYQVRAVDPFVEAEEDAKMPASRKLTDVEDARAVIYHVPREDPDTIFIGLNVRNPAYHDVYRVDTATGERERVAKNDEGIHSWHFHEGELRKASRQTDDGGTQILEVTADGEDLKTIYECAFGESCGISRFHPDGQRLYLRTNAGDDRDLVKLALFDPKTGEEEEVHSDPDGEVDLAHVIFSEDDDRLLATVYHGDHQRIYPQDDAFAGHLERLESLLPEGNLDISSMTQDESRWTVSLSRDTDPGTVYLYDAEAGELDTLYRSRPDLPSEHLATMEPIRYEARDGLEIPGYLTLPPGADGEELPVVVHPHGGPWVRDTWGYRGSVQFLANRGYAVFQPNFRGSSGYGQEFLNAGNQEWGTGAMQHDITDGVQHLIDEGIADPDRVAIYGASYGGFATLAGLAFTPELYAAGVSVVGPSNIISMIESFPPYWKSSIVQWHRRVGNPDDPGDRERLKEQSPLFSAEQMRAPLMVVHGANDPRVVQAESDQIVTALRDAGHDVEYLVAEDEGHGFVNETNRLAFIAGMERFLAQHIGGRQQDDYPEPIAARLQDLRVDVTGVEPPNPGPAGCSRGRNPAEDGASSGARHCTPGDPAGGQSMP